MRDRTSEEEAAVKARDEKRARETEQKKATPAREDRKEK